MTKASYQKSYRMYTRTKSLKAGLLNERLNIAIQNYLPS